MTLTQFLAALTNTNMVVTVLDSNDTELVKMYAAGYQQLLETLLAKTVSQITFVSAQAVTVKLAE